MGDHEINELKNLLVRHYRNVHVGYGVPDLSDEELVKSDHFERWFHFFYEGYEEDSEVIAAVTNMGEDDLPW